MWFSISGLCSTPVLLCIWTTLPCAGSFPVSLCISTIPYTPVSLLYPSPGWVSLCISTNFKLPCAASFILRLPVARSTGVHKSCKPAHIPVRAAAPADLQVSSQTFMFVYSKQWKSVPSFVSLRSVPAGFPWPVHGPVQKSCSRCCNPADNNLPPFPTPSIFALSQGIWGLDNLSEREIGVLYTIIIYLFIHLF